MCVSIYVCVCVKKRGACLCGSLSYVFLMAYLLAFSLELLEDLDDELRVGQVASVVACWVHHGGMCLCECVRMVCKRRLGESECMSV